MLLRRRCGKPGSAVPGPPEIAPSPNSPAPLASGMHVSPDALRARCEALLPEALDLLRSMVEINSFTGNAAGVNRVGDLTAAAFAPLGFTAERVPSFNRAWGDHLVLTRPGTGPHSVAMVSHLDTVFPPEEEERNDFHWRREGDRIYGPGTHDIKGGTVMMWMVLRALRDLAPDVFESVTWRLFWNSSEEAFSPDFGEVCRQRFAPGTRAALVFEAEGREAERPLLVVARKGRASWRLEIAGRGAHAGGHHPRGANAIDQLAVTLQQAAALTDYSRALTVNIGRVGGGTVCNRVPHEAWAEGEFRTFDPAVFAATRSALLGLSGPGTVRSAADGFACQVRFTIASETRPWPRNPGTDDLFELWQEAGRGVGIDVGPQERGGLSDGNLIWDAVPTLDGLGPWGDNDHCSERSADGSKEPEYVAVSGFVPKAVWNTLALHRLVTRTG